MDSDGNQKWLEYDEQAITVFAKANMVTDAAPAWSNKIRQAYSEKPVITM